MSKYIGVYPGAGTSALYIGLGFIPKAVRITNIDQAEGEILIWNVGMWRSNVSYGGRVQSVLAGTEALLTTAGVNPYWGGDLIATASANYIIRAEMVAAYNGDQRAKGASSPVTRWTKDTTALKGHFDFPISSTYVNVGSLIWIRSDTTGILRPYVLRVLANDGDATDDITLDAACPTGAVERITYFSDFVQTPVGVTMPQGIAVADTTYLNVSGEECVIEAEDMGDL
jgi:hypothetical protein